MFLLQYLNLKLSNYMFSKTIVQKLEHQLFLLLKFNELLETAIYLQKNPQSLATEDN